MNLCIYNFNFFEFNHGVLIRADVALMVSLLPQFHFVEARVTHGYMQTMHSTLWKVRCHLQGDLCTDCSLSFLGIVTCVVAHTVTWV
jgi:hypothetical protein